MKKILFAGEGGQGIQTAAEILARAADDEGKQASYIPNFGVEQRGGISLAFVIIGKQQIHYPKFAKADIVAVMAKRAFGRIQSYLNQKTIIIKGDNNLQVLNEVNRIGNIVKQKTLEITIAKKLTGKTIKR